MKNRQAFPGMDLNISSVQQGKTPDHLPYFGMTLRDYFAAHALQGILACNYSVNGHPATVAYQYADEMIKESEKQ